MQLGAHFLWCIPKATERFSRSTRLRCRGGAVGRGGDAGHVSARCRSASTSRSTMSRRKYFIAAAAAIQAALGGSNNFMERGLGRTATCSKCFCSQSARWQGSHLARLVSILPQAKTWMPLIRNPQALYPDGRPLDVHRFSPAPGSRGNDARTLAAS